MSDVASATVDREDLHERRTAAVDAAKKFLLQMEEEAAAPNAHAASRRFPPSKNSLAEVHAFVKRNSDSFSTLPMVDSHSNALIQRPKTTHGAIGTTRGSSSERYAIELDREMGWC